MFYDISLPSQVTGCRLSIVPACPTPRPTGQHRRQGSEENKEPFFPPAVSEDGNMDGNEPPATQAPQVLKHLPSVFFSKGM